MLVPAVQPTKDAAALTRQLLPPPCCKSCITRGVFWDRKTRRWRCQLGYQSKKIFLGYFDDAGEAARAYDQKLVELRGAGGAATTRAAAAACRNVQRCSKFHCPSSSNTYSVPRSPSCGRDKHFSVLVQALVWHVACITTSWGRAAVQRPCMHACHCSFSIGCTFQWELLEQTYRLHSAC
eukprot:GHRQ01035287.1.p1 GENE.GHRQ01035287.1~~GHRQ01035287.1.p1  ORF type:complete len:180 (-),score=12.47 GHRQ01035287.1:147-686(-)